MNTLEDWILGLNILGWRTAEMAEYLGTSFDHVKQHFALLHLEHGTSDRLELAMLYLRTGGKL